MCRLTGQLFFRNSVMTVDNRPLLMVMGVLAGEKSKPLPLLGEHQYTTVGYQLDRNSYVLRIIQNERIDRTQYVRGYGADGVLTAPIWRV